MLIKELVWLLRSTAENNKQASQGMPDRLRHISTTTKYNIHRQLYVKRAALVYLWWWYLVPEEMCVICYYKYDTNNTKNILILMGPPKICSRWHFHVLLFTWAKILEKTSCILIKMKWKKAPIPMLSPQDISDGNLSSKRFAFYLWLHMQHAPVWINNFLAFTIKFCEYFLNH